MEGEDNFLSFLPIADRTELRDSWYQGIRSSRKKFFTEPAGWRERETPISFATDDTQREFYDLILGHLGPVAGLDNLNRCEGRACVTVPGSPALLAADKSMRRLARIRGERLQIFPENAFVRVLVEGGPDLNYSLIQNREWTNVTNFLENANKADRDPSGDTMTVVRQFSGAYPNFFFVVPAAELDAFVAAAETVASIEDYQLFVARYGVRRTAINFWEQADWFQNQYLAEQPVEGGILDLNRYENR